MNNFLQDSVATVLTSNLNELILLSHGYHLRSTTIRKKESDKSSQKMSGLERNNLPAKTLNEIKFHNDLKKLIDIYLETLAELQAKGTFHTLLATVDEQVKKSKEAEKLVQEHKSNQSALKSLKSKQIEFKSEADSKLMKASATLNDLKSDWRIISKINELEHELVIKWEHTRFTQATIVGVRDEEVLRKNYSATVGKIEAEQRVITGFKEYSKRQFDMYFEMIQMWKERYSKEMDELLSSISEKKKKLKEVKKSFEKHHKIYCTRQKFIEEYLEQKAEQNRQLELQMKRVESAIKVQAWWRGVMVRRCLGPYRKKSKKGKKGKKTK